MSSKSKSESEDPNTSFDSRLKEAIKHYDTL